jgi:hypothetical protein
MKNVFGTVILCLFLTGCSGSLPDTSASSPSGNLVLSFFLSDGQMGYFLKSDGQTMIDSSSLSIVLRDQPLLGSNMKIQNVEKRAVDEVWEMPWGEQRVVHNQYQSLKIWLTETAEQNRKIALAFKIYDDGIGFRYEIPEQNGVTEWIIEEENTEFQLVDDPMTWWIPGDWDSYEHLYNTTRFSAIDAVSKRNHPNLASTYIPFNAVNTPITMKSDKGYYLSFHEANLTDYAGMTLLIDNEKLKMTSGLVGSDRTGYKAKVRLPFNTPWRTIQVAKTAGELIESNLIVNLNEPSVIEDISWFKPMKYLGVWWEMHLGKSTWDMESSQNINKDPEAETERRFHGATTENVKAYIDFASKNNIGGVLVEGWNTGWGRWIGFEDREGVFDFVTPYADYDIEEIVKYSQERGVEIIMHHETSAAPRTYDQQKDTAYALMQSLGINSVKTGYVGKVIPKGEYHHGQWMVNHYHGVLETAAKYEVAINAHEPIKGTGKRRTYPNAIAREGLRGQEFNAWSIEKGNPPEHLTIIPFTRMLAGPIDFTPGIFNIKMTPYRDGTGQQINTTLAHQLALYVVVYSPIQMAADLYEHYEGQPAFQFIQDVGVDWEQSRVLAGEIGKYLVIARQERETLNWFIGGVTNEQGKRVSIALNFLEEGTTYDGVIYKDGESAHWNDNPTNIDIETTPFKKGEAVEIEMAPGGGFAISLLKK